jgi:hypothetical protein
MMIKAKYMIGTAALVASATIASAQTERRPETGSTSRGQEQEAQPPQGRSQGQPQGGAQQRDRGEMPRAQQGSPSQDRTTGQSSGQPGQATGQAQQRDSEQDRSSGQAQRDAEPRRDGQSDRQGAQQGQRQQDNAQGPGTQGQGSAAQDRNAQGRSPAGQQQGAQGSQSQQAGRTAAQGRVELREEQRTRIEQTILARNDVPRISRADFEVRVGAPLPQHVTLVDVPPELIEINPEWRGYKFVVVEDEIVIVRPDDRRIVAEIPVGGSRASGTSGRSGSRSTTRITIEELPPEEIRVIQEALVRRGFRVEVTGRLDDRTRRALVQFKQRERLGSSVELDTRTVAALGVQDRVRLQGAGRETTGSTGGAAGANQTGSDRSRGQDQGRASRGSNQQQQGSTGSADQQRRGGSARGSDQQQQGGSARGSDQQQQGGAARVSEPQRQGGTARGSEPQQQGGATRSSDQQQQGSSPHGAGQQRSAEQPQQDPAAANRRNQRPSATGTEPQGGAAQERQRPEGSQ